MEPDFSGWATKANLRCSDGRTIMKDAFAHQDGIQVPLVWQHAIGDPMNVLGHAILTAKPEGIWADGYFNETPKGKHAKMLVQHKDINQLSIFANELIERSKQVFHGVIKEVSLVIAGANKGARIEQVRLAHSDGFTEELDDAAYIFTGEALVLQHADFVAPEADEADEDDEDEMEEDDETEVEDAEEGTEEELAHADENTTVQDVLATFNEEQTAVLQYLLGSVLEGTAGNTAEHSAINNESDDDESDDNQSEDNLAHMEGTDTVSRNVFEKNGRNSAVESPSLSHDQLEVIVNDAQRLGSLKEGFLAHAEEYGITDIDLLFPDAKAATATPELIARRTEWVAGVIDGAKHSPFSRIKSTAADLTADEARAKGYVKGNRKKDEVIKLLKRVTTPTTIYKKQKLDRDDIVDITDLDVVTWLKWEMRFMLEEEMARAILIGDGREPDDEDKIDEDHLRPIAWDDDMYNTTVVVPSNTTPEGYVESIIRARKQFKGTGRPAFYTTADVITDMLLITDKLGRFVYEDEDKLAAKLRVARLVEVEVLESEPDLIGIMVNIADYTIGADKGGELNFFDDFDIDYNQYKYLYETRVSGALTKPKSAVTLRRTSGTVVTPSVPAFNAETNTITIPSQTGVKYYNVTDVDGPAVLVAAGALVITETTEIEAVADAGYSFPHGTDADWTYAYTA